MEVSEKGGSSKSYQVLLVSVGSPMISPASLRVVCTHLGLCYGSATAPGCFEYAFDCTNSEYESKSKSSDSSES
jgi:hypothetical protein